MSEVVRAISLVCCHHLEGSDSFYQICLQSDSIVFASIWAGLPLFMMSSLGDVSRVCQLSHWFFANDGRRCCVACHVCLLVLD